MVWIFFTFYTLSSCRNCCYFWFSMTYNYRSRLINSDWRPSSCQWYSSYLASSFIITYSFLYGWLFILCSLNSIKFQIFLSSLLRKSLSIFLISLRNKIWFCRSSFNRIDIIRNFAVRFLSNKYGRQRNIFCNYCQPSSVSSYHTTLWMISPFSLIVILIRFSRKWWILILFI